MPLFDYYCSKCGYEENDVFVQKFDEEVKCKECKELMEKRPPNFSFSFTPAGITRFKTKYGKSVPPEYKTSGGANIYGVPRKS
jgi:putative FmdB family regulatory protein